MKIVAIFSDYDGTLSPLNVPREKARIPSELYRLLDEISHIIPIAIITTKDLAFVKDKVPFAHAIAAICGLEIQVRGRIEVDNYVVERAKTVDKAYQEAIIEVAKIDKKIFVERKTISKGILVAFCIDWRLTDNWSNAHKKIKPILKRFDDIGLYVVEYTTHPFADIYAKRVDKGQAFKRLKEELEVIGPIMYLGDSEADNPAFDLADVSIGIKQQRNMPKLSCKYFLAFNELSEFLYRLMDKGFEFEQNYPWLISKL
ncbi:MAG: HAD-IIB family hydrolase [archaeon]|nr:HAD-IIB family hydrolase [archaeon]MCP8316832.1 HAD-IIB family hydrolase [archaeon]MCP8319332.1 HAD-IIB family hydrolase [archaeon]